MGDAQRHQLFHQGITRLAQRLTGLHGAQQGDQPLVGRSIYRLRRFVQHLGVQGRQQVVAVLGAQHALLVLQLQAGFLAGYVQQAVQQRRVIHRLAGLARARLHDSHIVLGRGQHLDAVDALGRQPVQNSPALRLRR